MKTIYKKWLLASNVRSEKFPKVVSIMLVLFFLVFGSASMLFLLHTPG